MRIALLGRTRALLETGRRLHQEGHTLAVVGTCRAEAFYGVTEADFQDLAKETGAEYFLGPKIDRPEIRELLLKTRCEVGVSLNWLTLIPQSILDLFPYGVLNAHPGDLPRYRGNACPNWAILNGEKEVGLCVHAMASELDSGPVYARSYFPLTNDIYIGDVYEWLNDAIPTLFSSALKSLDKGLPPEIQSQDPSTWLRCYPRKPEDGRIDWTQDATAILRLIRASSRPFDGAFCYLNDARKVWIWRATLEHHQGPFNAVPGQVLYKVGSDPIIGCGKGVIKLTDLTLHEESDIDASKRIVLASLRNRLK